MPTPFTPAPTHRGRWCSRFLSGPAYLVLLLFALWANSGLKAQSISSKPNVLYVVVDDLNDYLWAGDNRPADLPNLAALAADGVRYDACYATSPLCGPSRVSFLTGKDPDWTGVFRNEYVKYFRKYFGTRPVMTIMEHLREEGYYTVGINKVFHNLPKAQFDNDFDAAETDPLSRDLSWNEFYKFKDQSWSLLEPAQQFPETGYRWGRIQNSDEDRMADTRAVGGAIDVLSRYADNASDFAGRPLMLTVGIIKPHTPHVVPAKHFPPQYEPDLLSASSINYQTPSNPGGWPLPDYGPGGAQAVVDNMHPAAELMSIQNGMHQDGTEAWAITNAPGAPLSAEALRNGLMANANMAYMAAARYVDAQLGRLMHALDSLGLDDNTIVVFHSDHGFAQGEHRHWAKKALWETDGRVPLIIKDPRESGGQVVHTPVSLLDIFPTLCELTGVGTPTVDGDPDYLDGRSVWPLRNQPISGRAAQSVIDWNDHPSLTCNHQRSVYEGDWHLIQLDYRASGDCTDTAETVELLFNIKEDPYEWEDLSGDFANQGILTLLRERLMESVPQDRWSVRILSAFSDTLDDNDPVALTAQLFDADGNPVALPAGTALLWQLAPFPYNLASNTSINFNTSFLPLYLLAGQDHLRINLFWRDVATNTLLGFDTKSFYLDLPLAATRQTPKDLVQQPVPCNDAQWYDLLGRPIDGPIPGRIAVNACGQSVWMAPGN